MITLEKAYEIANEFYKTDECYDGILEIRESQDNWLFEGRLKHTTYGTNNVCVPKNGEEPYLFNPNTNDQIWKDAMVIEYKS